MNETEMRYLKFIFTIFVIFALNTSTQGWATELNARSPQSISSSKSTLNYLTLCSMKSPPNNAELIENHGLSFYSHPMDVSENFSGCRYMWLEDGEKLYSMYYQDGKIVWMRGNKPGRPESICYYTENKLDRKKSKNPDGCRTL